MNKSRADTLKCCSISGTTTSGNMTLTILSRHSKTIQKLVEEQMKQEAKLGFDPWGDTAQEEFECQTTLSSMLLKILKTIWKSCFMYKRVLAEKQIPLLSSW